MKELLEELTEAENGRIGDATLFDGTVLTAASLRTTTHHTPSPDKRNLFFVL